MAKPTPSRPPLPADALQARDFIPLDQFITMPRRTRELNLKHVASLAESIAAIGLIHPPAVDRDNRLLAGAHRVAALIWLRDHDAPRFQERFPQGVPVWRMDLNADSDVDLALAVEISENEQRRDYQPSEILKLADRLKDAGFRYTAEGGRPKAEDRPLMPALELIVGKSVRQLRRILNPPPAPKTRTYDLVSELNRLLELTGQVAKGLDEAPARPELEALKAELGRVTRLTERAIAACEGTREQKQA